MATERILIQSQMDRAGNLAAEWAFRLDSEVLDHLSRDSFALFRWTDPERPSRASADGSITLQAATAAWMSSAGHAMYDAHIAGRETRPDPRMVRAALADFTEAYLDARQKPPLSDTDPAAAALDAGLRANLDLAPLLRSARVDGVCPGIDSLSIPDRQPMLQGAVSTLTEALGRRLQMQDGELEGLLRRTAPAERFEFLADQLIQNDPSRRRLPDGSALTLPEDHVARLRAKVTQDFRDLFGECHLATYNEIQRRSRRFGENLAKDGYAIAVRSNAGFRDEIQTDQPGYSQVSRLVWVVQHDLSQGQAPLSAGGGSGARALQLAFDTDYWNGDLKDSSLPAEAAVPGYAGADRSLTFDRTRVIDVLANADTTAAPTAEVRRAVRTVASQAAYLCNPEPGSGLDDPVNRALDEQLRDDFARHEETRLLVSLGFRNPRLSPEAQTPTVTSQVVATLAASTGRYFGMQPHEVTARLLTTPPGQRFEAAAALGLANAGGQPDSEAHRTLAAKLRTGVAAAVGADGNGRRKLHPWSRTTAGDALSRNLRATIDKARRPFRAQATADDRTRQQLAAALSGQAVLTGSRAKAPGATEARPQQADTRSSERGTGISG
ncbi:hypothetical protein [Kribbella sp. NPDC004536]|uniref:hypothetical protein n=1 Tax=Kribbella sp. NPDC004536 TaxID=3364106 RepID=UPI0036930035